MLPKNLIKKLAVAISMVIVSMAASVGVASADIQDFYVRNNSGDYVWYIYVSPTYADSWEEDVLGSDVLPPKSEILIEMSGYGRQCDFDVKVEDEYGNSEEYFNVDLCTVLYVDFE